MQTASPSLYACGSAYEGTMKAADVYSSLLKMAWEDSKAYDALVENLEKRIK